MEFVKAFCAFLLFGLAVSKDSTGCPTLSVSPCTCTNIPSPVLECDKLYNSDELRNVFINSVGTRYREVRLTNSVLQYIPNDIFERVEVKEFHVINGTLIALFDTTPESVPSLQILSIVNTRIYRGIDWEQLQPMENLMILNMDYSDVEVLGSEFAQYAPKSLKQISFYDTKTTKIESGVFEHFPNLDRVAIDHNQLGELKRDIFPVPFNGRYVYFNENQLTSLPADMFSNMPNLRSVSLRGNSLTTLPRYTFENLHYLDLEGNPLTCDCDLAWIIENESMALEGTCSSPESVQGRKLKEVYKNMSCL